MMTLRHALALSVLASMLACSGGEQAEKTADAADADSAKDHVWKEQVETIDRARDVEKTLKENDAAKRKAMDEADGG